MRRRRRRIVARYFGPGDDLEDYFRHPWGFIWGFVRIAGMLALAGLVVDLVDFGDGIVRMAGVVTLLLTIAVSWAVVEVAIVKMMKERRGG